MQDRIILVPIGQGGGNIVDEILEVNPKYHALFVNTSKKDLDSLRNAKHTYHIPNAEGCGKNRDRAIMYAQEYYEQIIERIFEKFSSCDIVIFVATMAGGSGSGITPPIIGLARKMYPNKHYGFIGVLPKDSEDIDEHINTIECWNNVMTATNDGEDITLYLLDNNKREKESEINKEFATSFNDFINMSEPSAEGNIDDNDLLQLLTKKGSSIILEFDNVDDVKVSLAQQLKDSIFAEYTTNTCEFMGISTTRRVNTDDIKEIVGYPRRTYQGYNSNKNIVVATGIEPQRTIIEMMNNLIEDKMKLRNNTPKNESMIIKPMGVDEVKSSNIINKKEVGIKQAKKEIDIDDFFSKYMK